ncbi:MAG: FHA domain-containing protein [Thermosynechococcaceae cyanobacterium MS004]|nr:FHA domain-containing protein [Thermosynechococcaceae cyanobacterium MS004]
MIILTLLHPVQSTPVQSWSFDHDPVVRIGRAVDNHVVLYSAVVSRYHVEVRFTDNQWEVVNLGTNGTYLDGKRVQQAALETGNIIRLARSGPNIQVTIDAQSSEAPEIQKTSIEPGTEAVSIAQDTSTKDVTKDVLANTTPKLIAEEFDQLEGNSESSVNQQGDLPKVGLPKTGLSEAFLTSSQLDFVPAIAALPFYVGGRYAIFTAESAAALPPQPCDHKGASEGALICADCGYPIHPIQEVGPFTGLRRLSSSGNTLLAWRAGHTVVLKTLSPALLRSEKWVDGFEQQARQLCQLEHPSMPKVFEAFEAQGQPYLVSEMIYGSNLKDLVGRQGALPQYQAIQWMLELSRLLDYLQQQAPSHIHGAISPSNIIRPAIAHGSSQVVLVNFGKVKGEISSVNTFTGASGYLSPEQSRGEFSTRSDLYSLGATLLFLLTGKEPDAFYQLGDREFRLQAKDAPNLSPALVEIIHALTHPDPEQRIGVAKTLIDRLQALL